MKKTILNDLEDVFRNGNMLNKIILVNILSFIVLVLVKLFFFSSFEYILNHLSLSTDFRFSLLHPWTIISYMFVHIDLYHLIFNMLVYYWFGNIVGDLIGDKKILSIYIIGGIGGSIAYFLFALFSTVSGIAFGASAAVMATVSAAVFIAPNYMISLILLGRVPIKYIAIAYVVIDLAMISNQVNTGGHIAHIGGFITGGIFVYLLNKGIDMSLWSNAIFTSIRSKLSGKNASKPYKTNLRVTHKKKKSRKETISRNKTIQKDVDKILDKVKKYGYEKLTKEEKETLFIASNSDDIE